MQIRKTLLPLLLCPFAVLAAPEANANPVPDRVAPRAPQDTSGSVLSDLPEIVNGVQQLLDQESVDKLSTIINGGATLLGGDTPQNLKKLLSEKNIGKLQDVIDNAHTLLSDQFVNQTTSLIDDAAPVRSSKCIHSSSCGSWLTCVVYFSSFRMFPSCWEGCWLR
jgi:hypothetical protein